jgi:hypothetical protein
LRHDLLQVLVVQSVAICFEFLIGPAACFAAAGTIAINAITLAHMGCIALTPPEFKSTAASQAERMNIVPRTKL